MHHLATFGISLPRAALLALALLAGAAEAGQTLNWTTVAYTNGSLTGGPYTLGNGTVSVAITGDTGSINAGPNDECATLTGGLGCGPEALFVSTDYPDPPAVVANNRTLFITFTFTHPNGVRNISFDQWDVDASATTFTDRVVTTAVNNTGTINPSSVTAGTSNTYDGTNTVTGTAGATDTTNQGTVSWNFNQTRITSFTVAYQNAHPTNTDNQYTAIYNINFTPEQDLSTSTKTVSDLNGGQVAPGDTLRYTVTISNAGGVDATNVTVYDDIPANITGWSLVSSPAGSTDNSTVGGGANGTGLAWFSGFTVAAGASVTLVYDVTVDGSAANGTPIDNAAQIYDTIDNIVVNAPTMFVNASSAAGQVKELYIDSAGTGLSRTRPTGTTGNTINESTNENIDLDPDTARSLTLAAGNIPVVLRWACSGNNANRSITVTLSTTGGTAVAIGNQNQTVACPGGSGAGTVFGTTTFNVNLAAVTTFAANTNFRLNIAVGAGSGARNIIVRGIEGGVYSRVELNALTVINVDTIGTYTAAYPGGSLATDFTPGSTVYIRAVVGDPFGAYDISPTGGTTTTIDITDADANLLVNDATMTLQATGTATKTYEYAYALASSAPAGIWPVAVTAYEGVENTVTDTLAGSFRVYRAEITLTKSSAVISDPVNGTGAGRKRVPGAVVRYTLTVANDAGATATADPVVVTDVVPSATTYVTSSLYESTDTTCNTSDTALTDTVNTDRGSYDSGTETITFGDTSGGTDLVLAPGQSRTYCYDVTVD